MLKVIYDKYGFRRMKFDFGTKNGKRELAITVYGSSEGSQKDIIFDRDLDGFKEWVSNLPSREDLNG